MTDLNIVDGSSTDEVVSHQNAPAAARPTPIAEIDPEQGTVIRLKNLEVDGKVGIPMYMKLRASDGAHIPINSSLYFEVERAGQDGTVKHSVQMESLDFYEANTLSEQRDADKRKFALLTLTHAENAPQSGPVRYIDIRDVDSGYLVLDSADQVDWSQSRWFIASEAAETLSKG